MKRTRIFTLVMAIFWTVIAIAAVLILSRAGLSAPMNVVLVFLAFVCVIGNWLRWYKNR